MLSRLSVLALCCAPAAFGSIRITEWMYNGTDGEFIEFTNVGPGTQDFTGWSFDDDSRTPGSVSLSAFGMVASGESVILCEPTAAVFRASWGLAGSVKVIGSNNNNLGRNDEINIYDNMSGLIDRLTYGDQNIPGSIRTLERSGWTTLANLGTNNASAWVLSTVGDAQNSRLGTTGDIANPGTYIVPTPGALSLLALSGAAMSRRRRN